MLDYFIKEYVEVYMDGGYDECAPTNSGGWGHHEGGAWEVWILDRECGDSIDAHRGDTI